MKIDKKDIEDIMAIINSAEEFRPIVQQVIKTVLSIGPEIQPVLEGMRSFLVQSRIKSIAEYERAGFTREDAITMTLDEAFAIRRVVRAKPKPEPDKTIKYPHRPGSPPPVLTDTDGRERGGKPRTEDRPATGRADGWGIG